MAAFFTGTSDTGLFVGAVVLGVGSAGGDLMWSLWVTKFAPPDRIADYMGLHTFFTGIRAVPAPIVGFVILEPCPLVAVAWSPPRSWWRRRSCSCPKPGPSARRQAAATLAGAHASGDVGDDTVQTSAVSYPSAQM